MRDYIFPRDLPSTEPSIDWTLAPSEADAWEMTEWGKGAWTVQRSIDVTNLSSERTEQIEGTVVLEYAPDFGFVGDWRTSRRVRPAPATVAGHP